MRKFFLIVLAVIGFVLFNFNLKLSYSSTFSSSPNFLSKNAYPHLNYSNEINFKKAYNNYLRGKYIQSAAQFRLYLLKGRILKNYALYYTGLCFFKLKEYHKADYAFLKLAESYPKFTFYKNAIFYLAVSEKKNGYYYSEISHLRYIIEHSEKSQARPFAMFKIYKAYMKLKNYGQAGKYFLRLYIDYPLFSKKHGIRFKYIKLTEPQKIRRGTDLYYDSYYSESISLLKNTVNGSRRARLVILKDLMKLKSPLFLKTAKKCLSRGNGIDCYKYYGIKKSGFLSLEVYYYYYILKNPQKTLDVLNYTAGRYGYLNKSAEKIYGTIVWDKVLKDLKNERLVSAARSLKAYLDIDDAVNGNNAKFFFWYGVVLEKLGYKNRASFYFNIIKSSRYLRYSYYGIMSGIMIKKMGGISGIYAKSENAGYSGNASNGDAVINPGYLPMFKGNIAFKRFKAFLNLKLYFLSNIEMRRFIALSHKKFSGKNGGRKSEYKKTMAALTYMLYRNGYYAAAIGLASNLIYNYKYKSLILNRQFLKILYPRPYFSYVSKYSAHYGVPADLIYGVMRQESLYNPACYSIDDARGLMQIIPSTGYYIARRTGCYNFNPSMLYKKKINISFGSYYLRMLLKQFDKKKYLAIASYNAGPGAVSYWRNYLFKNDEMFLFIELIPFNQTRNYVKRVLANYYVYNSIYKY